MRVIIVLVPCSLEPTQGKKTILFYIEPFSQEISDFLVEQSSLPRADCYFLDAIPLQGNSLDSEIATMADESKSTSWGKNPPPHNSLRNSNWGRWNRVRIGHRGATYGIGGLFAGSFAGVALGTAFLYPKPVLALVGAEALCVVGGNMYRKYNPGARDNVCKRCI